MFPEITYGCLCATMLHLETQVLREGDYLVSYYASAGFQPARLLLMSAFPLVAIKYANNVIFTQRPNHRKENEDVIVTLLGAVLANACSLKNYKILHFVGVGLWLYGLQILTILRRGRGDSTNGATHTMGRVERLILTYQEVLSVGFGISYFLKYKAVTQLIQFGIILLYSLWYGKELMQIGSGFPGKHVGRSIEAPE
jgi:hypothetical protein